jgi:hypothetical protein
MLCFTLITVGQSESLAAHQPVGRICHHHYRLSPLFPRGVGDETCYDRKTS